MVVLYKDRRGKREEEKKEEETKRKDKGKSR